MEERGDEIMKPTKNTSSMNSTVVRALILIMESCLMLGLLFFNERLPFGDWIIRIIGICLLIMILAQTYLTVRSVMENKEKRMKGA